MRRNDITIMQHIFRPLAFVLLFLLPSAALSQHGQLYSGLLERGYPKAQYANTPYYPLEFRKGTVTYHGYTYEDVSLKTDLHTGQLIILSPATGFSLTYAPQDLEHIVMDGIQLSYLEKPSSGWYELLAQGKDWMLYRQNSVSAIQEAQGSSMVSRFFRSQRIFLYRQDRWIPINNLSTFCKQFKEHKSEIQAFAKRQGFRLNVQDLQGWKTLGEYVGTSF